MKKGWVYILECSDGSFYTGVTSNLEHRLYQHYHGLIAGYTQNRRPLEVKFSQEFPSIVEALAAEQQIKGWTQAKKKALIEGDFELLILLSRSKKKKEHPSTGSG